MSIEIKVPDAGESIREVHIGRWLKKEGDSVAEDEDVVELETDKASMELPAPAAGVLREIRIQEGETAAVGDVIAILDEGDGNADGNAKSKKKQKKKEVKKVKTKKQKGEGVGDRDTSDDEQEEDVQTDETEETEDAPHATPAARRELQKYGLSAKDIAPAGKRIRPEDVRRYVEQQGEPSEEEQDELEEVIPMSYLRKRIAQRLVEAQQKAALLTTFNEIDMSHVVELRKTHGEEFHERYGVKLGFMSFFVKATVDALKQQPELNAEIRDEDQIVYRNYFHVGIAIGAEKGLVVPVLRNSERLSFAQIEQAIDDFARRAKENELAPDELQGGTFTISNGGVYGSLLSTPIVNPPQSGVLGMHAIEDRPVAREGQVVIRPMMYVALTYDHRIVDGRGAISFLKRVKEAIEEPSRMLVEV